MATLFIVTRISCSSKQMSYKITVMYTPPLTFSHLYILRDEEGGIYLTFLNKNIFCKFFDN